MKVLITGGSGYLGSQLIFKLLKKNFDIQILDLYPPPSPLIKIINQFNNCEYVQGDLTNLSLIEKLIKKTDSVIHLAAYVGGFGSESNFDDQPNNIFDINYDSTKKITELCSKYKIQRFIFSSSCGAYGKSMNYNDETSSLNDTSTYSQTKIQSEKYITSFSDLNYIILRFPSLFGYSMKMSYKPTFNALVHDAIVKKNISIFGPNAWRPFLHIDDATESILTILNSPIKLVSKEIFNVGSNNLNRQKKEIANIMKKHSPKIKVNIKNDNPNQSSYKVCFDKINSKLNYTTTYTLENGIIEMSNLNILK